MNIDLEQLPTIKCPECNKEYWKKTNILKKVSALISPNGQEGMINVEMYICENCKTPITNLEEGN